MFGILPSIFTKGTSMEKSASLSRRAFGKWVAVVGGGTAAGVGGVHLLNCAGEAAKGQWLALTDEEIRILEAVAEQIIPTDRDPGAKEARVVVYIDRQLAPGAAYAHLADRYREWLAALDSAAKRSGKPFAELPWGEQTRLLREAESDRIPKEVWNVKTPQSFFRTVVDHVKQGFYGTPAHGGNFNYVSYRMLGVIVPTCTGRNRVS